VVDSALAPQSPGHQFIEALSNEEVWATIKHSFPNADITTLEIVALQLLEDYARKKIGQQPPMNTKTGATNFLDPATSEEEWITAARALSVLGIERGAGTRTICKRAYAGLIKARAERFVRDGKSADNFDVPAEFWWAEGEAALDQNWVTGDFDTWIDHSIHLEAFGVTFRRSDIEGLRSTPVEKWQKMAGTNKIFIGHGRSLLWRELKDFLVDRLNLAVDEFNSVPTAGVPTADRLGEMLAAAAFAFLIMTGEDEQPDGKVRARENVVHEAGLFQGRLGFKKAIILLEEGCEEFSNIRGLGEIRFPKGNVAAKFEEIRRVLERERIISAGRRRVRV
jgi:hypothetical protein